MSSARNYYTDEQLAQDAKYWRKRETEHRLRARSQFIPDDQLRYANTAKLRAEASENILRQRDQHDNFLGSGGDGSVRQHRTTPHG
jgi:hypothetical protein